MNCTFMLSVLALMLAAIYSGSAKEKFDVEAVIGKERNLKMLSGCFLETSPCDALSEAFKKKVLRKGIEETCTSCTTIHKRIFKTYLGGVKTKFPEDYDAFKQKYDPESKYLSALEAAVANA